MGYLHSDSLRDRSLTAPLPSTQLKKRKLGKPTIISASSAFGILDNCICFTATASPVVQFSAPNNMERSRMRCRSMTEKKKMHDKLAQRRLFQARHQVA